MEKRDYIIRLRNELLLQQINLDPTFNNYLNKSNLEGKELELQNLGINYAGSLDTFKMDDDVIAKINGLSDELIVMLDNALYSNQSGLNVINSMKNFYTLRKEYFGLYVQYSKNIDLYLKNMEMVDKSRDDYYKNIVEFTNVYEKTF